MTIESSQIMPFEEIDRSALAQVGGKSTRIVSSAEGGGVRNVRCRKLDMGHTGSFARIKGKVSGAGKGIS
ncbi:MAG: hypothetical protein RI841_04800 [Halomonas sp.]|uniref:hypothetical protein n=1 Tax=Halomonas sp. TaxID=1486246 RepID=UPI0028704EF2|nr:hypothetical protein [Halomonas sp.]MDR9438806.1 hypothetical protein [Halomonas sp.]